MIMTSIYEDFDEDLINREELKKFVEKFEKEIKQQNWKEILKQLDTGYNSSSDFALVKSIFENILNENILSYIDYIPNGFFKDDEIKTIEIPSNITSIADGAFSNCKQLEAVIIPDSVTKLGEGVFSGCSALKEVKLPEKLDSIPNKAFLGCSSLEHLFIPDSVKRMGYDVFSGCPDSMVVELNRGVKRQEDPDDPHPNAVKMKTSTHDFVSKHLKWKNV